MQSSNKADIIRFQKYMKPSGCCQACLSEVQINKDCIITCEVCRSCIHQTHYGSELAQPPQIWQCERCRYFLENGPSDIACQFCPSIRGIMKQYMFENRKIWLHPECAVWGFPTIFFVSNKKQGIKKEKPKSQSTYFWVRDYQINQHPCQVCKNANGYRIKCKYYSCTKSYHVTCARPEGIVRDLQSMKIENGAGYFPVYCKEHLELKIDDCKKRTKLLKEKGDIEKAAHYQKVGNLHAIQLKNLETAVKKCKLQEEMIKKMSAETIKNIHGNGNVTFNELDQSFQSDLSKQFLKILQEQLIDQQLPLQPIEVVKSSTAETTKPQSTVKSSGLQQRPKVGRPPKPKYNKHQSQILKQKSQIVSAQPAVIQVQVAVSLPANATEMGNQNEQERKSEMEDQKQEHNGYEQMFQNF